MKRNQNTPVYSSLRTFAGTLKESYGLPVAAHPEDQLKPPLNALIFSMRDIFGVDVRSVTEVEVKDIGIPDVGVTLKGVLAGYIELKAPGKGADPNRLTGADKEQWERFKLLPNLMYTDGNEWALYRSGVRVGRLLRFSGDVTLEGASGVDAQNAEEWGDLFKTFLDWEPQVPNTPRELAKVLAPVCKLLKQQVAGVVKNPSSTLAHLADDWRQYLFPDADDDQFADAYAQTLTYALLLAQLSGEKQLSVTAAVDRLKGGHALLADTLKILGDPAARKEIAVPVDLLERIIAAVDISRLTREGQDDPWLYFYEDFLAEYDPKMRNNRGVFYTPWQVVQAQVRLVAELLKTRFNKPYSFVDEDVITLDPACGTGTYLLSALQHGLDCLETAKGKGMRKQGATRAAGNMYGFEILVGPYAVAHLRLSQQILQEGGSLPEEGAQIYLTDTLEAPTAPPQRLPAMYMEIGKEHKRALRVKSSVPVMVCIGNPPYDRQSEDPDVSDSVKRKGGWVRFGEEGSSEGGILRDFIEPLAALDAGLHAKNLYNDYIYFWRWALWKVMENSETGGVVSFITASSYLAGPGFAGVREMMRTLFDEIWIINLEGDNLGARKTENVFDIQVPVAIFVGVRKGSAQKGRLAKVEYARMEGTREEKFAQLDGIRTFSDLQWRTCPNGTYDAFLPLSGSVFETLPKVTDIFPWQENGMQFKRTWPIGSSRSVLLKRWQNLIATDGNRKQALLRETDARKITSLIRHPITSLQLARIIDIKPSGEQPAIIAYAYRSFDRLYAINDSRLCDRPRPTLQRVHGERQVYLTSLLTGVLGAGPAAVVTGLMPDLDTFRGINGAKHIIPLYRNPEGTQANLTGGVLDTLGAAYGSILSAEEVFAYTYAMLATPRYVRTFWEELTIPGPRLPITRDAALFQKAVRLGRRLIWLHTYGERFIPEGKADGEIPHGQARCEVGTPSTPGDYPETYRYDESEQVLWIGQGKFSHVRPQVWNFSVSGLQVVKSWLDYRKREPSGKKSSPLNHILPDRWEFDGELLDLLWVLDGTVDMMPQVDAVFEMIVAGECFRADELPQPTSLERRGPASAGQATLFDLDGEGD